MNHRLVLTLTAVLFAGTAAIAQEQQELTPEQIQQWIEEAEQALPQLEADIKDYQEKLDKEWASGQAKWATMSASARQTLISQFAPKRKELHDAYIELYFIQMQVNAYHNRLTEAKAAVDQWQIETQAWNTFITNPSWAPMLGSDASTWTAELTEEQEGIDYINGLLAQGPSPENGSETTPPSAADSPAPDSGTATADSTDDQWPTYTPWPEEGDTNGDSSTAATDSQENDAAQQPPTSDGWSQPAGETTEEAMYREWLRSQPGHVSKFPIAGVGDVPMGGQAIPYHMLLVAQARLGAVGAPRTLPPGVIAGKVQTVTNVPKGVVVDGKFIPTAAGVDASSKLVNRNVELNVQRNKQGWLEVTEITVPKTSVKSQFAKGAEVGARYAGGFALTWPAYLGKEAMFAAETGSMDRLKNAWNTSKTLPFWLNNAIFTGTALQANAMVGSVARKAAPLAGGALSKLPAPVAQVAGKAGAFGSVFVPLYAAMVMTDMTMASMSGAQVDMKALLKDRVITAASYTAAHFATRAVMTKVLGHLITKPLYGALLAAGPMGWLAAGALFAGEMAVTWYLGEKIDAFVRSLLNRTPALPFGPGYRNGIMPKKSISDLIEAIGNQ
ncbi:MAG: hypothetical protein HYY16_00130 [Planctomycetes bacterium]|nr:hypothetical protein [Planctomycetota bacterium]